jgi:hypothetical protein
VLGITGLFGLAALDTRGHGQERFSPSRSFLRVVCPVGMVGDEWRTGEDGTRLHVYDTLRVMLLALLRSFSFGLPLFS